MIYFDNAATTYPKPEAVYEAIDFAMKNYAFNSGRGSYLASENTFKMINDARQKIAKLVNSNANNVVFTGSATESLNDIVFGLNLTSDDTVLVSPFDHNAIVRTIHGCGAKIAIIPFNKDTWELDEKKYNDLLVLMRPKAIIISHISNVTGFELPYSRIFEIGKKFSTINVLDSAQGFGIYKVCPSNVDFVVFAGHKSLYAMMGIAGYINISNMILRINKYGGTGSDSLNINMPIDAPLRYEAGSLNSVGIYSISSSLDFLFANAVDKKEQKLMDYLLKRLSCLSKIKLYLPDKYIPRGILSLNVEGYKADEIGDILSSEYNICVRTGYHCAPLIHDFIGSKRYGGTVRISMSYFNTYEEIDILIDALKEIA